MATRSSSRTASSSTSAASFPVSVRVIVPQLIKIESDCFADGGDSDELAEKLGLQPLPTGAAWGGREAQPEELLEGVRLKIEKGARADDVETGGSVDDDAGEGRETSGELAQVLTRLGALEQKVDRVLEKLENATSKAKQDGEGTLSFPEAEVDQLESSGDDEQSKPKRKRTCAKLHWRTSH